MSPVKYSKEYGSFGQYRVPPPLFIFLFCAYFNFLTKTLNVEKEAIYAELDSLSMTATPAVYNFLQQTQIPFKDFFGSLEGSYFAKKDSQNLRQLNKILHDFHVRCLSYFGGAPGSVEFMRCTLAAVLINSSDCGFKRIPVLGAKEFFKRRNIAEIKTQYSALITQTASGSVDCTEGERSVAVFGTKIDRNFFENDVNIAKRVIARVSLTLLERLKTPSGTYQFIVTEFEALSNLFDPKSQKTTAEPHALSYENVYCVSEEFEAEFFRQYPPIEMFPIEFYGKNERVDKRNPLSKYLEAEYQKLLEIYGDSKARTIRLAIYYQMCYGSYLRRDFFLKIRELQARDNEARLQERNQTLSDCWMRARQHALALQSEKWQRLNPNHPEPLQRHMDQTEIEKGMTSLSLKRHDRFTEY